MFTVAKIILTLCLTTKNILFLNCVSVFLNQDYHITTKVVFTPYIHMFFWPGWRNLFDVELKFRIFANFHPLPNKSPKFQNFPLFNLLIKYTEFGPICHV